MDALETTVNENKQRELEIQERFDQQEREFVAKEEQLATFRSWFAKHRNLIAPFKWTVHFTTNEISFYKHSNGEDHPKRIAIAFGKDGWTRKKDGYTCGCLHWVKEFDGVKLEIQEAEYIELKPREAVRL